MGKIFGVLGFLGYVTYDEFNRLFDRQNWLLFFIMRRCRSVIESMERLFTARMTSDTKYPAYALLLHLESHTDSELSKIS